MSVFDGTVSPTRVGNFVIGAIDYINGSEAVPSGFVVTKHELGEVARYWCDVRLSNEFKCFETATSGSTEWRIARYSSERLDAIARVLGIERRNAIDDEVTKAFQRRVNPADWVRLH